ncbi:PIG-L family deacetylase [Patescibacteria group bacterium]|nr:PIG-L family deacetylase [Patescibacteria group bacterium]
MQNINCEFQKHFPNEYPSIFLHAHPDDESFLSGGVIIKLSQSTDVHVIYCAAALVKEEDKTITRQNEAQVSNSTLGVKSIHYLEYCESKYSQIDARPLDKVAPETLAQSIIEKITTMNLDSRAFMVSYDKYGGYGNKDHIVVHKAGRLVKKFLGQEIILYEVTINREQILSWLQEAQGRLEEDALPKLSYWSDIFGLSEEEIDYFYELTEEELCLKKKSLSLHKSQIKKDLFPMNLNNDDFRAVFGKEYLKKVNHV